MKSKGLQLTKLSKNELKKGVKERQFQMEFHSSVRFVFYHSNKNWKESLEFVKKYFN